MMLLSCAWKMTIWRTDNSNPDTIPSSVPINSSFWTIPSISVGRYLHLSSAYGWFPFPLRQIPWRVCLWCRIRKWRELSVCFQTWHWNLYKVQFFHNEETDGMYCPMGQRMERLSDARRITNNGFVQTISRYKARNYKGCPLRCRCYRSRSERIVQVNHRLRKIKEREREKLLSDEGLKYRSQRPQDVEAVFGNLKNNKALQEVPSSWI